ncbi:triphosphoribosyl-dephospho-CoA synthase [Candidatus Bathyarchaeota archaeon]|nr:triphosphoribosyl-dephospho-CoA synthase [Candidatus Bathyarchaeota archaeon]
MLFKIFKFLLYHLTFKIVGVLKIFKNEDYIAQSLQLAMLLEVSAYPKPGNVHRTRDFLDTKFEHFLASAVALNPCWRKAAYKGFLISLGKLDFSNLNIGELIKEGVEKVKEWHHGGNTSLGTIMLLMPIAVAAGKTFMDENFNFNEKTLRENLKLIVESSTFIDAINVYKAINLVKPGGLGETRFLDVKKESSINEIIEKKIPLFEILKYSSSYDSISFEWVKNYKITFELGLPFFIKELIEVKDLNVAIVNTYLKVLSEVYDTLIIRKMGLKYAIEVSNRAKEALKAGGLKTIEGRKLVFKLDEDLAKYNSKLNPGATADIISSILAVAILKGVKP